MSVESNPQWAEVKRMLDYVGAGHGGGTGTLYSDEARLILKAIGKPETLDRNKIAFLITDLCEHTLQYDAELGICGTGSMAFKAADQIIVWATGADKPEPDNETLRKIGAFGRSTKVGKHQATNWVHLRQTIKTLDAAGQSDAADTLIWTVWHEVNGAARAREYHRLVCEERDKALAEAACLRTGITDLIAVCEQDTRDQDHNGKGDWGPGSKAYAEGRGTACRGIAARLKALVTASASPALMIEGETP